MVVGLVVAVEGAAEPEQICPAADVAVAVVDVTGILKVPKNGTTVVTWIVAKRLSTPIFKLSLLGLMAIELDESFRLVGGDDVLVMVVGHVEENLMDLLVAGVVIGIHATTAATEDLGIVDGHQDLAHLSPQRPPNPDHQKIVWKNGGGDGAGIENVTVLEVVDVPDRVDALDAQIHDAVDVKHVRDLKTVDALAEDVTDAQDTEDILEGVVKDSDVNFQTVVMVFVREEGVERPLLLVPLVPPRQPTQNP
ncbi:hypothetical protein GCK72_016268 [Caenorhabditis remanei]|uniref:Uncharacterized protein n=1 Tax=Caenorhabditis remanei TaxID=31234 RepID=A0A6A5GYL3_CAERE|nr:hypothetical protein GCK72_016268 [Caenorhabditis remanei]KAF1759801.1 hypothetical protein GCK72_016268 [Caenorhabditis remanei]